MASKPFRQLALRRFRMFPNKIKLLTAPATSPQNGAPIPKKVNPEVVAKNVINASPTKA